MKEADQFVGQQIVQRITTKDGDVYIITRNNRTGTYTLWLDGTKLCEGESVREMREPYGLND